MTQSTDTSRVAVYIDFDNVVISRYDQLHGEHAWRRDNARDARAAVADRLATARVDIGAILDYASSFGTIAVTRAYADWSVPANALYENQLVDRAIDLTQLFPASGTKNGADIRLAVDVLEDLFRLPDMTHVVIVAGDSDYIALAQRCRRLGRVVVGIGVPGGTSKVLVSACDEFAYYDEVVAAQLLAEETDDVDQDVDDQEVDADTGGAAVSDGAADRVRVRTDVRGAVAAEPADQPIGRPGAGRLLIKALGLTAVDDDGWSNASSVKNQMKRLNPQFNEKALGFGSFTEFVSSRSGQVELREDGSNRLLRARRAPRG